MATQIQLRRGTATQNNAFTGAVGEVTADTTNNKLRLHDGSTAGGHEIGGTGDISFSSNEILTTDDQMVFKIDSDNNETGYEGYYFYGGPVSNGNVRFWVNGGAAETAVKFTTSSTYSAFLQKSNEFKFIFNEHAGNHPVHLFNYGNGSSAHINLGVRHADARVRITDQSNNLFYALPRSTPSNGDVLTASDGSGTLGWAAPSTSFPASGGTFTGNVLFRNNYVYFSNSNGVDQLQLFAVDSGGSIINSLGGDFKVSTTSSSGSGDIDINIKTGGDFLVKSNNVEKLKVDSTATTIAAVIAGGLTYPTSDGSSGQFLKTDGSGNLTFADAGGGLDYFTEGISTSSPHSASSGAVKLEASGTPARLDVYLHPKDDGALCNGSEGDGNKRGVFAVDLQATRNNADEVASGGRSAILGGSSNKATVNWSTAVGGRENTASGVYSFLGGGYANTASGNSSAISGGQDNTATTDHATVVGGFNNDATNTKAFVGGGQNNTASGSASVLGGGSGNTVSNYYGFIGGGTSNVSSGVSSAIAGGSNNTASGQNGFVGGGASNTASSSYSFVGGGETNEAKTNSYAAVVGGKSNDATGAYSFVGGGKDNTATGEYTTIGGGDDNNASGSKSTVAGGRENEATGAESAVSGGYYNFAEGNQSFAGGGIGNKASSTGSVVCGGNHNEAKTNNYTAVVGGQNNDATGELSFLGGGYGNTSSGSGAVVGGGQTNLASSQFSTVAGGNNNTASGTRSIVLGGAYNQADGGYATVVGGRRGYARGTIGKIVFPACSIPVSNTAGAQQAALLVVGASTTDATTTTLRSDSASASATNQCVLANGGSLYAFTITVVGRETSTGHYASIKFEGVIDKQDSSSNVTIRTTPTKTVLATNGDGSNWDAAVDADTTNQALRVKVTGEASTTIKWVAKIDTIELGL